MVVSGSEDELPAGIAMSANLMRALGMDVSGIDTLP